MNLPNPRRRQIIAIIVTLLLTGYQVLRLIVFVAVYGGIEHDGGWMLSISRSLAEQGTYTTMVSTIADPAVPGGVGVDGKFDIQAPDGRIWFFTGNGIGPASIIPDALVIWIFGSGFWALHLGPLLFYTFFLLLAALILYRLAGLATIVLFHAFLFFYSHLSIFLGYEAMGEVPAMFYVLWAYLAFVAAVKTEQRRSLYFFLAGLVIGLALNAKLITLWSLSGIFVWAGVLWLAGNRWLSVNSRRSSKVRLVEIFSMVGGAVFPVVLWELVHLFILTRLTNFEMYFQHADQRLKFILDDGSGVGLRIHSGPEFFWDKFFLLSEVVHPQRWVTAIIFLAILGGGLGLLWYWRNQAQKHALLGPMWLGWLANTVWFVSVAKTGWPRHFWFGLVLATMLLSVIMVSLLRMGLQRMSAATRKVDTRSYSRPSAILPAAIGILLLVLIVWGFVSQPYVWAFFVPDGIVPYWQQKQIENKYDASLPWIIVPRAQQAQVVDYIRQMPPEARVYFPGNHKVAEIPAQTGRIHYPLKRRSYVSPHPADIALIGPSLISPWKDPVQRQDLLQLVERECPRPALKNDFYMICPIKDNVPQQ